MEFGFAVLGVLLALLVAVLVFARYSPKSGAEILDWKPTRSPEVEAELELDDVEQMIAARNERRRRRGASEISEEDFRREVQAEERARRELGARYRAEHGGDKTP
jgi:hypothetical protein